MKHFSSYISFLLSVFLLIHFSGCNRTDDDFDIDNAPAAEVPTPDSNKTTDTNESAAPTLVVIYKTGIDDGIIAGEPFGADRNFTAETIDGDRIVHVGVRTWQDSVMNEEGRFTQEEAVRYCQNLVYASFDDWRLPNRHEMYEIVNYGHTYTDKPTIDDIFQHATKRYYWISENLIGHNHNILSNLAFTISLTDGVSYPMDRSQRLFLRCVRGERLFYINYIERGSDGIYHDQKTGFMWAKIAGPETMSSAKSRCENLLFSGYSDWRLPNINELHTVMPSVVDESRYPYLSEPLLRDAPHQLWSSTIRDTAYGRYLDNYWNNSWGGTVLADGTVILPDSDHPLGRDIMNDATIQMEDNDSVYSICIRGGHL